MKPLILLVFIFFSICRVFAINPDREYIRTPDSVNWQYQELKIPTKDNYVLNTWIYKANEKNDKDTVLILAYPDAGNMSYFVYHSAILANAGYTVVTFDYRGFGKSDDFEIQREYLYYPEFALDLEAVVGFTSKKFADNEIGVWGMSMGTTIISRAYPKIKNQINFIIGEGFVTNPSAIVDRHQKLGKEILLPEASQSYEELIHTIETPLLILSASDDTITSPQDALNLQSQLGQNCKTIEYKGTHLSGFQVDYETKGFGGWFIEQIENFLKS
ncbi:alpha/beta hydrolase [Algoriphagus aestuariicola]|uniref:Alpha/beta hydrolase n=1 Tax=Algoriphagus aestuariicola TaxID=1852016 RepID=A0ABS3BQ80_9BACT|nr:alpha/beta fold hydrolase [Algoriphagus aestuariicola]MBN7801416.1 alpha/beta hydrolase [Algoriphagus aestuariicola]